MNYQYGIDAILKGLSPITPASEAEADEIFGHAQRLGTLPDTYIVRAVVRCNQFDTFRMVQCDWTTKIEYRAPFIEAQAKARLGAHLRRAHPYLGEQRVHELISATHFNLRDR